MSTFYPTFREMEEDRTVKPGDGYDDRKSTLNVFDNGGNVASLTVWIQSLDRYWMMQKVRSSRSPW